MIIEATTDDIPALLEIGEEFFSHLDLDGVTYNPQSVGNTLEHLIESPTGVVFRDDQFRGVAAGMLYPYWMNTDILFGNEIFWWVNPESRGMLGLKLLSKLENWAKDNGCAYFQMTSLESIEPERTAKIYDRKGYAPFEHNWVKRL